MSETGADPYRISNDDFTFDFNANCIPLHKLRRDISKIYDSWHKYGEWIIVKSSRLGSNYSRANQRLPFFHCECFHSNFTTHISTII